MNKKLIVGNWKMNPLGLDEAKRLYKQIALGTKGIKKVETLVCPPSLYLADLMKLRLGTKIGAQDCHFELSGAFTGSVSAPMLKDLKLPVVILGHSERRAAGDTDEVVNKKIKVAIKLGLKVILCIGEKERDDHGHYLETVKMQLEKSLAGIPKKMFGQVSIAYEPVWAIGANAKAADTPEDFQHTRLYIKKILSKLTTKEAALAVPVLYGGSVNRKNALEFLAQGEADGLLVGRESLSPQNFVEIVKNSDRL